LPLAVRTPHVDLDEGAGQRLRFPRCGGFACAKANDDVLPTSRLTGSQGNVADDPVALVEDAEHRDALGHRRDAFDVDTRRRGPVGDFDRTVAIAIVTRASAAQKGQAEND
jgi:hypothetical protein